MLPRLTLLGPFLLGTVLLGTVLLGTVLLSAAEPQKVADQIDAEILRHSPAAVPVAGDVEFLRRAYLDLTGCIPTAEQAAAFLAFLDGTSNGPGESAARRSRLIDELLASEGFGRQLGRVWRDWIAPAELPSEGNGGNQPIKATRNLGQWFADQFNANRPWDKIVEAIINVDGDLKSHPQGLFFSLTGTDTGIPEPAGAARAVSSLFLGLDLQCAQCHDDPYREWKQTDFWNTAAFFRNMEAKFNGRYFNSITESFGRKLGKGAKKTTTRDASPNGSITIPKNSFANAGSVVVARYILGNVISVTEKQPLRPFFSEWLVSPENPYFARAFVNRTWSYLFARGLVEPIDDMRPDNPPTHPVVLALLTQEFIDSKFDVKHLIRCIVNTKAYQRTSSFSRDQQRELVKTYGRHPLKLMSTDQLYDSLKSALSDPKLDLRTYDPKDSRRFGESSPVGDEYMEFQRLFETDENDATNFTHGIPQFLALLNHKGVTSGGPRVEKLLKDKVEPGRAVKLLYMSTLARPPTDEEAREALEYVNGTGDRKVAYAGVLWTLLNRSEFMLVR